MTTRYNYELAVTQFADYLGTLEPEALASIGEDAADAVEEPTATAESPPPNPRCEPS